VPQTKGEKRREQLLAAALELFAAEGYDRATTRAIAEKTGVTEAALFKYFPTKRELFLEVVRRFGPAVIFDMPGEELADMSAQDALRRAVGDYLDGMWRHRPWMRVLFQEAARDEVARGELQVQFRKVRGGFRRLIEALAARGEVREGVARPATYVMMMAIRGFLGHAARRAQTKGWTAMRDRFVDSLVDLLMHGIAADETSDRAQT